VGLNKDAGWKFSQEIPHAGADKMFLAGTIQLDIITFSFKPSDIVEPDFDEEIIFFDKDGIFKNKVVFFFNDFI